MFAIHMKKSGPWVALLITSAMAFGQPADRPRLTVAGEVLKPLSLTREDLARMPQVTLKAKGHDNVEHDYGGVTLYELLKAAGVTLGNQLRGENLAKYLLVTCGGQLPGGLCVTGAGSGVHQ